MAARISLEQSKPANNDELLASQSPDDTVIHVILEDDIVEQMETDENLPLPDIIKVN